MPFPLSDSPKIESSVNEGAYKQTSSYSFGGGLNSFPRQIDVLKGQFDEVY